MQKQNGPIKIVCLSMPFLWPFFYVLRVSRRKNDSYTKSNTSIRRSLASPIDWGTRRLANVCGSRYTAILDVKKGTFLTAISREFLKKTIARKKFKWDMATPNPMVKSAKLCDKPFKSYRAVNVSLSRIYEPKAVLWLVHFVLDAATSNIAVASWGKK